MPLKGLPNTGLLSTAVVYIHHTGYRSRTKPVDSVVIFLIFLARGGESRTFSVITCMFKEMFTRNPTLYDMPKVHQQHSGTKKLNLCGYYIYSWLEITWIEIILEAPKIVAISFGQLNSLEGEEWSPFQSVLLANLEGRLNTLTDWQKPLNVCLWRDVTTVEEWCLQWW